METKYTKVRVVSCGNRLTKKERAEILHYANTFICGTKVEDEEKTFVMEMNRIEGNLFRAKKSLQYVTPNGTTVIDGTQTVLVKLK